MEDVKDKDGKLIGFKLDKKESSNFASWLKNKIKEDKPVETLSEQQSPNEVKQE